LELLAILLILSTIILLLLVIAVYQIKSAGMQVKDFWSFIKANDTLDKLYAFAEKYEKLSPQQQVLFLNEANKVFDAFDKVPNALWEEDYNKYMKILTKYKDIKILRWHEETSTNNTK
jgi:biopolymer transport protein ExbB/TolQ